MANDTSYLQQIAALRQERALQERENQLHYIRNDYVNALKERDEAAMRNDRDGWHLADSDCQRLEQDWAALNPPQRPQMHPQAVAFLQKNRPFLERHGQAADQAIQIAHQYATRPRNPTTNNPAYGGMGLTPNTPQYFEAVKNLLAMYAKDYGLRFDPDEEVLDANQAAEISGLSPKAYNRASQTLARRGRFSFQNSR